MLMNLCANLTAYVNALLRMSAYVYLCMNRVYARVCVYVLWMFGDVSTSVRVGS